MERTNIHHPHCDGKHPSGGFGCRVQERSDWEDSLREYAGKLFEERMEGDTEVFVLFVRNLVISEIEKDRAALVKEIEGMKEGYKSWRDCGCCYDWVTESEGHDEAIDKVLSLLSTKKED